jgi:predicted dehydrogenase
MSLLPPARIAVIGAGLIGRRHISHVVSEPETTLVAIVDCHPRGAALAESNGVPIFASLTDLVDARNAGQIRLDAVIICTPTHTHVRLGIEAVEAGLDCLIEKPIASTAEETRSLLKSIEESDGVKVLIGHHRRL